MISTYAAEISSSLALPVALEEYARTFFLYKYVYVEHNKRFGDALIIAVRYLLVGILNLGEGCILVGPQQLQALINWLHPASFQVWIYKC